METETDKGIEGDGRCEKVLGKMVRRNFEGPHDGSVCVDLFVRSRVTVPINPKVNYRRAAMWMEKFGDRLDPRDTLESILSRAMRWETPQTVLLAPDGRTVADFDMALPDSKDDFGGVAETEKPTPNVPENYPKLPFPEEDNAA